MKLKKGMRVIPISKTPDGRTQGLENSVCWKNAKQRNQPFLYVIDCRKTHANSVDYPEILLSEDKNSSGGDYFLISDVTTYPATCE